MDYNKKVGAEEAEKFRAAMERTMRQELRKEVEEQCHFDMQYYEELLEKKNEELKNLKDIHKRDMENIVKKNEEQCKDLQGDLSECHQMMTQMYAQLREINPEWDGKDADDLIHRIGAPMNERKQLPKILSPAYNEALRIVGSQLDPGSFNRFIHSSKEAYRLAKEGHLKTRIDLSAVVDERRAEVGARVFYKSHKPLSKYNVIALSNSKWFELNLSSLTIHDYPNALRDAQGLLNQLEVASIRKLSVFNDVDVEPFLQKYNVENLNCFFGSTANILRSPALQQLKSVVFNLRTDDDEAVMKFIKTTTIPRVCFQAPDVPSSFARFMVEKWMTGETSFQELEFAIDDGDCHQIFSDMMVNYQMKIVARCLDGITEEELRCVVGVLRPMVVLGADESLVFVRHDLKLMGIEMFFDDEEESYRVTLRVIN